MRSHYNVEIEHMLMGLLDRTDTELAVILKRWEVDAARLSADLNRSLDRMKTGNARAPALSPDIIDMVKNAWLLASVEHGANRVRSGHLLWALLSDDMLARRAREISAHLAMIEPDVLKRDFVAICGTAPEAMQATRQAVGSEATTTGAGDVQPGGSAALDQFTTNLTAQAKAGKIDPILGRDSEIRQMIDILTRRRQNNPLLAGEAGVGKTAVVEGLALRIASGDVPPALRDVSLRSLDLGLLQAGASMKGEFENRLKSVIEETKASAKPIILFIDEAHTLIGAGGAAGQNDAANLLKPALARGELRTIAATTWAEYKKYFEKDAALTRRFQPVKVEEPSEKMAVAMIRGLVDTLEQHHKVRIVDEAVSEAVRLSARYIPARQLPDKAVSLLDTACARVAMSQNAIPAPIDDRRRRQDLIETELRILDREIATGADHAMRREELIAECQKINDELAKLEERWKAEKEIVAEMDEVRAKIEESATDSVVEDGAHRARLTELSRKLRALQGEQPLIFPIVDSQAVAEIVENWTGIPAGRMQSDEIRTVLNLRESMEKRVIGQSHAMQAVAQAIHTSRAGLTDPRRPIGAFLFVGTSGVGKTETALALAELLYGGEQNVTTINMAEFKEEHKVSLLMGSPPGYVGYGEGGVLTEAVRRRPYSVVLLDEMEKAHSGVQDVFYSVLDKGNMKDGEGRDIDFKNTVIIMTSNAGTDLITKLFADPETAPDAAGLADALRPELAKFFKPAFMGRLTLVPYFPLSDAIIRQIVVMQLERIRRRVRDGYRASFDWEPQLVEAIAARCTESTSGARNVENILTRTLLPELSAEVLARLADGESISSVRVGVNSEGAFEFALNKP